MRSDTILEKIFHIKSLDEKVALLENNTLLLLQK